MYINTGYVYIAANSAIPGYVKVGMSGNDVILRVKNLQTAGIPKPFKLIACFACQFPLAAESLAKRSLTERGFAVSGSKECFTVPIPDAIAIVADAIKGYYLNDHILASSDNLLPKDYFDELQNNEIKLLKALCTFDDCDKFTLDQIAAFECDTFVDQALTRLGLSLLESKKFIIKDRNNDSWRFLNRFYEFKLILLSNKHV